MSVTELLKKLHQSHNALVTLLFFSRSHKRYHIVLLSTWTCMQWNINKVHTSSWKGLPVPNKDVSPNIRYDQKQRQNPPEWTLINTVWISEETVTIATGVSS